MSINFRLKSTKIINQRKEFYRQRIPGSSCTRAETVDIDIPVISRNGDKNHAIYQNNVLTSLKNKEVATVEPD